jgi:hypothetical protein
MILVKLEQQFIATCLQLEPNAKDALTLNLPIFPENASNGRFFQPLMLI